MSVEIFRFSTISLEVGEHQLYPQRGSADNVLPMIAEKV